MCIRVNVSFPKLNKFLLLYPLRTGTFITLFCFLVSTSTYYLLPTSPLLTNSERNVSPTTGTYTPTNNGISLILITGQSNAMIN